MTVIRKDAFKRAAMIDTEMGWQDCTAIGKLATIWEESQTEGIKITEVSGRQILKWAGVSAADADLFLAQCCDRHFLEARPNGRYFIVGNDGEIARIDDYKAAKVAAGIQSGISRRAKKEAAESVQSNSSTNTCSTDVQADVEQSDEQNANTDPNENEPSTSSSTSSSTSASASYLSEGLSPPGEQGELFEPEVLPAEDEPPEKPKGGKQAKPPTDGSRVWEAYAEAYRDKYGVDPVRNATVNAQCGQLVARLGVKDAVDVAKFYVGHADRFYVAKHHSLGLCLKDAESLRTQMVRGRAVTSGDAADQERRDANRQAFENVAAKMRTRTWGGGNAPNE